MENSVFDTLNSIAPKQGDVKTLSKNGSSLKYISWAKAWESVKKAYPNATYKIHKNKVTGMPYVADQSGAFVWVSVTIEGIKNKMMLQVMDSSNRAMKSEPYEYTTKSGKTGRVEAYTSSDINKAVMRCLVKAIATHGLFTNLYTGEDLPSGFIERQEELASNREKRALIKKIEPLVLETQTNKNEILEYFNITSFEESTSDILQEVLIKLTKKKNKMQAEAQEKTENTQEKTQNLTIKEPQQTTVEDKKIENAPNEQPQDKSKSSNTSNELIQDPKSKKLKENKVKEAPPIDKEIDVEIRLQKIRNNVKEQAKEQIEYGGHNDPFFKNNPRLFE